MSSRREFLKIAGGGVIAATASSRAWAQAKYPAKIAHLESPQQPRHRGL